MKIYVYVILATATVTVLVSAFLALQSRNYWKDTALAEQAINKELQEQNTKLDNSSKKLESQLVVARKQAGVFTNKVKQLEIQNEEYKKWADNQYPAELNLLERLRYNEAISEVQSARSTP